MQEFDPKSLEKYDGLQGRPCYVAVDGKVYDISGSDLWNKGRHMETHNAGRELSEALKNAPHGEDVLSKFPQVGILKAPSRTQTKQLPALAALLLRQHPHPITVHFPQALLTLAPLFLVLYYFTGNIYFERVCYYIGVTGVLTDIPAVLTGFFHWIFKYGRSTKSLFVFKVTCSLLLFFYAAVVVNIHTGKGILPADPVDVLMMSLYLVLIPLSVATGHAGGKIVFG